MAPRITPFSVKSSLTYEMQKLKMEIEETFRKILPTSTGHQLDSIVIALEKERVDYVIDEPVILYGANIGKSYGDNVVVGRRNGIPMGPDIDVRDAWIVINEPDNQDNLSDNGEPDGIPPGRQPHQSFWAFEEEESSFIEDDIFLIPLQNVF